MLKRLLVIALLVSPAAAWAFYKPIRVIAPQLVAGVSCPNGDICIEDTARYKEAQRLYSDAVIFVGASVAPIEKRPRVVFCSTEACFRAFGFHKSSARSVGTFGIVISPRGWTEYYLRHELIHHVQAERLGAYRQWHTPDWFKEGMAYSLSGDPRTTLVEPFQQYRDRFDAWYRAVGNGRVWEEAKNL